MPLYELFCIARPELTKTMFADLLRKTCLHIMDNQGVVRSIEHLGLEALPYRMQSQAQYHYYGRYWLIHFYAGPKQLKPLESFMKNSPETIRHTLLKKESRLNQVLEP